MLWIFPVASVGSMTLLEHDPHFGIVQYVAEWPVLWYGAMAVECLHPPQVLSKLVAGLAMCISGIFLMGVVGHFQDMLRVPHPRRRFAVWVAAVLASFLPMPYVAWASPAIIRDVLHALLGLLVPVFILEVRAIHRE